MSKFISRYHEERGGEDQMTDGIISGALLVLMYLDSWKCVACDLFLTHEVIINILPCYGSDFIKPSD